MTKTLGTVSKTKIPFPTSDSTLATLNNIVLLYGLPEEEIYRSYIESYQILKDKGVTANLEHLAINGVRNTVRKLIAPKKEPRVKAESFIGFIIGDSGLWDKIAVMRSKAKYYASKYGIKCAIHANLIDSNNEVLDQRKEIFGKPNDNYLKPLKENDHDTQRTLHLIAKLNGDEVFRYGTIQTNDHKLAVAWDKVKFFTLCQSYGIVKEKIEDMEKTRGSFKMNSSNAEDTRSIFKGVKGDFDVDNVFMEVITPELTRVGDVEKHHEAFKEVWDRVIFVKGMVAWINRDRPSKFGTVKMGLMDAETSDVVTVRIPEHVLRKIEEFGEQSEVVVIGKTNRQDLREEDEHGKVYYTKGAGEVVIDAVGVYGIKGFVTPVDINRIDVLDTSSEIEGWVD